MGGHISPVQLAEIVETTHSSGTRSKLLSGVNKLFGYYCSIITPEERGK